MLIIGIGKDDLDRAIKVFNQDNDSTIQIVDYQDKSTSRTVKFRCRFVPNRSSDKYGRLSHSGRRIKALCWHGHRDLFEMLFNVFPQLEIRTAQATYKGRDGFIRNYPATASVNIGSMFKPMEYQDACNCWF